MNDQESRETAERPPETPERFFDCGDETVFDSRNRLIWLKKDTWQMTGKWMNWVQSRDYAQELNRKKFAGYANWRLPTPAETKSLYEKNRENKDYAGQQVRLHPVFPRGCGFLCWTSEVRNKIQAVRFGYRKGGAMFDDIYRSSRGSTRLVRSMDKNI
ncbi:MAG: DUF1566 domain-containing protein [Nitrospinales bacterium]